MNKLLTINETARILRCGRNKVIQLIKDNIFPVVIINDRYFIRPSDVENYINSHLYFYTNIQSHTLSHNVIIQKKEEKV
jgi:hypothetical protein